MRYICMICGYVYDDAKEKVPFESLPASWKCPLCGAAKSDFKPEAIPEAKPAAKVDPASQPTKADPASTPTKASTPPTAQIDAPAARNSTSLKRQVSSESSLTILLLSPRQLMTQVWKI